MSLWLMVYMKQFYKLGVFSVILLVDDINLIGSKLISLLKSLMIIS